MPEGFEDAKPWHPRCCEVPMWLIEVRKVGDVCQHVFECKVCAESRCLALYARSMGDTLSGC